MKRFQPLQDSICLLAGTTPPRLLRPGEQFDRGQLGEEKNPKILLHIFGSFFSRRGGKVSAYLWGLKKPSQN